MNKVKINSVTLSHTALNSVRLNSVGHKGGSNATIAPQGEPPSGALKDSEGYYLVDRAGNYLTTSE